ncbi:MAG TPA: DUF6755 family protein [Bryobacteraceae bacterium]
MKATASATRARRRTVVDAALLLIVILLIVQIWLLTATLESYLAGHYEVALPGMLVSAVMFAGCFGLYRFVVRIDRMPERKYDPHGL